MTSSLNISDRFRHQQQEHVSGGMKEKFYGHQVILPRIKKSSSSPTLRLRRQDFSRGYGCRHPSSGMFHRLFQPSCSTAHVKRKSPRQVIRDPSSPISSGRSRRNSTSSLGLESLFSSSPIEEGGKPGTPAQKKYAGNEELTSYSPISPAMTSQKSPRHCGARLGPGSEIKSATMHVLLPPYPTTACNNEEGSTASMGGTPWKSKLEQATTSSSSSDADSEASSWPSNAGRSATELARTTWVLFPNGKYKIFVDYPDGVRKVFLSAPGAVYKQGPHQVFVPTGGDPSRPGLVVPQDMVHLLLLPLGIPAPQQQRSPVAVLVSSPVVVVNNMQE